MKLENLNDSQKRAVKCTEGPLLIIAGAGSGKTRVLTNRIAYLIDECGIDPYNIMAITFTNKAAREMKERVEQTIGTGSGAVWVSTFHSTCVRILRRYIDRIGYNTNFTIYDADDQKSLIKDICKKMNIDTKMLKERTIMGRISSAKDELKTPDELEIEAGGDYNLKRIAGVYREYQKALKLNNALDFDDLIYKTVELFEHDSEVLDSYQERFRYIMVDEYQDTNTSQFKLISLLAAKYKNLCVVGDDDQSIYKFRGANIYNILNFENAFAGAKVIKLEQNYRSTQTILNVANAVIKNNIGRKSKSLWTDNGEGDKVNFNLYESGFEEAEGVASSIAAYVRDGWNYNDVAILYRTNAQSRALEEKLMMRNIPYRIYGGQNFYQRKEIKDILAYLKTIDNGQDGQAIKRIINVPKRGIGNTTIDRIQEYADLNDLTFWEALINADKIDSIKRGAGKLEPFVNLIASLRAKQEFLSLKELVEAVIEDTRYIEGLLDSETQEEVAAREENINEFISKVVSYEETCAANEVEPTLSGLLEEVALIAEIDNLDESEPHVVLMTLHSAKGLEFPIVYMTGMEDGLFPSYMTIVSDDDTEIEEERRLCYVGITRAEKILNLTSAKSRMVRGETQMNKVSRFIKEIPDEYLHIENNVTGYNKSKIAFGGAEEDNGIGRSMRANAKSILSSYGSGTPGGRQMGTYKSNKVKIDGNSGTNSKVGFGKAFPEGLFDLKQPQKKAVSNAVQARTNSVMNAYSSSSRKNTSSPSNPLAGLTKGSDISASSLGGLGYSVGDSVSHVKFGTGKVVAIEESSRDYMVTVQFEEFGLKKMLAGFAKLKKL